MSTTITGPVLTRIWNTPRKSYAQKFKHVIEPVFRLSRVTAIDDYKRIIKLDSPDYVVGQVWGLRGPDRYLLWSYRQHANLHATMQAMRNANTWVSERWPRAPYTTLVEKSANGAEIIATLKRELTGVIPITVSTDKITRAIAAQPPLESGNIHLPGRAAPNTAAGYHAPDWVANLIEEAATFPNGKHDDQVDAFSQAIIWAEGKRATGPRGIFVPRGQIPIDRYSRGLIGAPYIDPFGY